MKTKQLQQLAQTTLDDLKGINIVALDVTALTTMTDVMIICSGTSSRHVKSLAEAVAKAAKDNQIKPLVV